MGGRTAGVVSLALLIATLSPVLRKPADDGFPLSTYPMFAWKRATTMRMTYALGVTAAGERRYLSPAIAGSGEVLQALAIFNAAVSRGGAAVRTLCEKIAARVAVDPARADLVAIRIVDGTQDAIQLLAYDRIGKEVDRVYCAVKR